MKCCKCNGDYLPEYLYEFAGVGNVCPKCFITIPTHLTVFNMQKNNIVKSLRQTGNTCSEFWEEIAIAIIED